MPDWSMLAQCTAAGHILLRLSLMQFCEKTLVATPYVAGKIRYISAFVIFYTFPEIEQYTVLVNF